MEIIKEAIPQRNMPDIANDTDLSLTGGTLDWVGMGDVEIPVRIALGGEAFLATSKMNISVSLDDPAAKGIHMSRLYLHALETFTNKQAFSARMMDKLVGNLKNSQVDLSMSAQVSVKLDWPLFRKSLKSRLEGFRSYPMEFCWTLKNGKTQGKIIGEVLYSSTCPCSAALSRQLNHEHFLASFSDRENVSVEEVGQWLLKKENIKATPHAQRSVAEFQILLEEGAELPQMNQLIDSIEAVLGTPVQTAVKREDEQEFARLNAENLMFCEDAARKLKHWFNEQSQFEDFTVKVSHLESLHAHDAVAMASKDK